jgi:peptidoglycan-associated lipoprotein
MTISRPMVGAALLPALFLGLLFTGCAKRPATTSMSAPAPMRASTGSAPALQRAAAQSTTPSASAGRTSGGSARPVLSEYTAIAELTDVHFDFDKYEILPGDAKILDADAAWLVTHADQLVLIEGHCDERGTVEYNLALGERRARATENYLVSRGVRPSRITVISYGKERPACTAHDEACWAQNRRAHFLAKRG